MTEPPCDRNRKLLLALFERAIAAAQPHVCLPPHLPALPPSGKILVVGAGKAAAAMAQATEQHYHALGQLDAIHGFVTTRHGYARPTQKIEVMEAGHPVPDSASEAASLKTLEFISTANRDDCILVLLSGGASALWSAPAAGLTLAAKQQLTRQLLKAGARIDEMNCIRKHLSRIKGGRLALAAAATGASMITCAISDVPHDDPGTIGSGPTVGDQTTRHDALAILQRYKIKPPPEISSALENPACETPKPSDPRLISSHFTIVAAPRASLDAAAELATAQGLAVEILGDSIEGEAASVARHHATLAKSAKAQGRRVAIMSGGELTVTIRGNGRGGPNQEYALALAEALAGEPGIYAIAGDTDGTDGGSGSADDPAGALVMPDTLARAAKTGLTPAAMLADNDSTTFFAGLGDLVNTGPTQTNVNDFRAIVVDGP
ncbi:MAG TPA: glycerate kinase [Hyphomicrobiaceae bacterium]|nr:glycerate kinase [Hyphomicrobiaceae bacterium]